MNLKQLKAIISSGESDTVEFKRSTGQRTVATKTACALLNSKGGYIVFGVDNNGNVVGQEIGSATMEDVAAELRLIDPPVFPEIEKVLLDNGKWVIAVRASRGRSVYTFKGRAYIRHGATTVPMPVDEYHRRLIDILHAARRWENEPAADWVTINDLDDTEIMATIENAVSAGRMEPPKKNDIQTLLLGLGLIINDHLINAAIVLYGKNLQLEAHYPQCSLRLARFRGNTRTGDFIDNRQYWDNAFSLMRKAESFLMDHVPIAGKVIPGKLIRKDQPAYPPRATREALANAFCHRDYTVPGGAVAVAMYDNSLEIINPGELHFGITPQHLTEPHESKPWNPIIASVFYRAGIIERWGSGTLNIIDWCKANGNISPTWSERTTSVVITFSPIENKIAEQAEPQLESQLESQLDSQPESLMARVMEILIKGEYNRSLIAKQLGQQMPSGQLHKILREMLIEGFIERTIPEKPQSRLQKYRLTETGKKFLEGER